MEIRFRITVEETAVYELDYWIGKVEMVVGVDMSALGMGFSPGKPIVILQEAGATREAAAGNAALAFYRKLFDENNPARPSTED